MTKEETLLNNKIHELEQEMKNKGLWQKEAPDWVNYFEEKIFAERKDFAEWLQFVKEKRFIVPAAIKFFGDDVHKGKLLQILIEIDSLL